MGHVPLHLGIISVKLKLEQVRACCKDLIGYCGKGGDYILSPGVQIDEWQAETVRALVDFPKNYGVN